MERAFRNMPGPFCLSDMNFAGLELFSLLDETQVRSNQTYSRWIWDCPVPMGAQ